MNNTSIVDFLNARLDEDERVVAPHRVYVDTDGCLSYPLEQWADGEDRLPNHHNVWQRIHDPARVLREVAAKQRVLERHREVREDDHEGWLWSEWNASRGVSQPCLGCWVSGDPDSPVTEHVENCPELRDLAAIYADHPDYRQEWDVD